MNYEEQLKKLRSDLEKATNMKNRFEGELGALKNQESLLLEELNKLGIKPEDLKTEIDKLRTEIDSLFSEAEKLMPRDILDKAKQ